ncbi:MAG TPA: sigma-70 family RNA polymerase sigma factor [Candidatus Acidoferrum sp.]|nr:sigma-70 family RNA polymerase sigma factor [Candidatus Acidoferrum sp.]
MVTSAAIAELLTVKRSTFLGLAKRYAPAGIDPEDCLQDAAVLALRFAGDFEGRAALSTWFGSIVRNCALMQGRRVRVANVVVDVDDLLDFLPDPRPLAESAYLAGLNHDRLVRAITQLSPRLRETLLNRMAGLSLQETADRMGIPLGTAKARLSRARNKIRERIGAAA